MGLRRPFAFGVNAPLKGPYLTCVTLQVGTLSNTMKHDEGWIVASDRLEFTYPSYIWAGTPTCDVTAGYLHL